MFQYSQYSYNQGPDQLQERLKEFTRGLAAVHITSEQIDELNATLDRMPKRE